MTNYEKGKNHLWHMMSNQDCLNDLGTSQLGLNQEEVDKRLSTYGANEIIVNNKYSILKRWLNQFNNVLIYILLVSAIITGLFHYWIDTSVIVCVVLLNALIGYIQEGKAEKAVESLKKILSFKATVIRSSKKTTIQARELVPGDIVLLHTGNKVPADLRLLTANNLHIDEAILTGESIPVEKITNSNLTDTPLTKRYCMAYSGTLVTSGIGMGVVVATGPETEVGKISAMLGNDTFSTPLLRQLSRFGRNIALIIILFSFFTFLFGYFIRDYSFESIFMATVALAVAIIPEGLPAIISIVLAMGVTRMAKHNAIVRRLASVETLSSVSVICTDKTGTLTKNELTVQKIITATHQFDISGSGYNDHGYISIANRKVDVNDYTTLKNLILFGVLCNEATLTKTNDEWHLVGNPMDGAFLALGLKVNLEHHKEVDRYPRIDAIPFDSKHKYMASLHQHEPPLILVKGAPEIILSRCSHHAINHDISTIDKAYWQDQIHQLAKQGMRVLAIAYQPSENSMQHLHDRNIRNTLCMLGIVGIIDSPREETFDAVVSCQNAGIRVKMITGDHPLTAQAIAKQIGIRSEKILNGENINMLSDEQLSELIQDVDIYARTVPEHKIRLIKALRKHKQIVAMTGDGVNDAPALKHADIGIAMGSKGSDVAKEASEIVLADDNFSSIKYAVEEGRNVYKNLKKAILFTLPSSGAEGFTIIFTILFGYTLPITPLQILWVNLVTAVTLGLAIAFDAPETKLMKEKPRDPNERLLSKFLIWRIVFIIALFLCAMFGLFVFEVSKGTTIETARTMVVNTLVLLEIVYLLNCRRIYEPAISRNSLRGISPIMIAVSLVILLQLAFNYIPVMQLLFSTKPLSPMQWLSMIAIALIIFAMVEVEKYFVRLFAKFKNKEAYHESE